MAYRFGKGQLPKCEQNGNRGGVSKHIQPGRKAGRRLYLRRHDRCLWRLIQLACTVYKELSSTDCFDQFIGFTRSFEVSGRQHRSVVLDRLCFQRLPVNRLPVLFVEVAFTISRVRRNLGVIQA